MFMRMPQAEDRWTKQSASSISAASVANIAAPYLQETSFFV
jgi:hypothetical protein